MADLVESGPGDAGVGEDKFRLIGENAVLSNLRDPIHNRSVNQAMGRDSEAWAWFSRLPPPPTDHKACLMR